MFISNYYETQSAKQVLFSIKINMKNDTIQLTKKQHHIYMKNIQTILWNIISW